MSGAFSIENRPWLLIPESQIAPLLVEFRLLARAWVIHQARRPAFVANCIDESVCLLLTNRHVCCKRDIPCLFGSRYRIRIYLCLIGRRAVYNKGRKQEKEQGPSQETFINIVVVLVQRPNLRTLQLFDLMMTWLNPGESLCILFTVRCMCKGVICCGLGDGSSLREDIDAMVVEKNI